MDIKKSYQTLQKLEKERLEIEVKVNKEEKIVLEYFKRKIKEKTSNEEMIEEYRKIPMDKVRYAVFKLLHSNGYLKQ